MPSLQDFGASTMTNRTRNAPHGIYSDVEIAIALRSRDTVSNIFQGAVPFAVDISYVVLSDSLRLASTLDSVSISRYCILVTIKLGTVFKLRNGE